MNQKQKGHIPYAPAERHSDPILDKLCDTSSKYINRIELLRQIEYNISDLSDEDAAGHIWWNKFKELVNKL